MQNDKMGAVKAAVEQLMALVSEADGRDMVGMRAPPPGMGAEGGEAAPESCEACKAGACVEHMSDDDMSALEG